MTDPIRTAIDAAEKFLPFLAAPIPAVDEEPDGYRDADLDARLRGLHFQARVAALEAALRSGAVAAMAAGQPAAAGAAKPPGPGPKPFAEQPDPSGLGPTDAVLHAAPGPDGRPAALAVSFPAGVPEAWIAPFVDHLRREYGEIPIIPIVPAAALYRPAAAKAVRPGGAFRFGGTRCLRFRPSPAAGDETVYAVVTEGPYAGQAITVPGHTVVEVPQKAE
jgi:hypothetical protein